MKLCNSTVSRILRKAGVPKSQTHTTMVRGWHNHTEGFHLRVHAQGATPEAVVVRWRTDWSSIRAEAAHRGRDARDYQRERELAGLRRCQEALRSYFLITDETPPQGHGEPTMFVRAAT